MHEKFLGNNFSFIHFMGRPLRIIQNIYPYHLTCRTNNPAIGGTLMENHYNIIATATEENLRRAMQYLNFLIAVRYNRNITFNNQCL